MESETERKGELGVGAVGGEEEESSEGDEGKRAGQGVILGVG